MSELLVIDPVQGEQLDLAAASPERLAQLLTDVRDHESRLRELKAKVSEELHARFDRERRWSMEAGGYKLAGKSDALMSVWDVEALQELLDELVAFRIITADAAGRAIQPRIEYKVLAAGVNALLKNPAIAERIEECRTMVAPTDRRITVTRL